MDAGRRILLCFSFRGKFIFKHDGKLLVKRIAAVGGDTVEKNGVTMTVPEGCYYVLGDNTNYSYDSRYWEKPFIKEGTVMAKLIY